MAFIIRIQAPQMHDRTMAFRDDFTTHYLATNQPFPIKKALAATCLQPTSPSATKLLLRRGNLRISGKKDIENAIGAAVSAVFQPVLNNQQFQVTVTFPQPFRATAIVNGPELSLTIITPVDLTFITKPRQPNGDDYPIPTFQKLVGYSINNDAIAMHLHESGNTTNEIILMLLLTGIPADMRRTLDLMPSQLRQSIESQAGAGMSLSPWDGLCPDKKWYVIWSSAEPLCQTHKGDGVPIGFQRKTDQSFDSEGDAQNWINKNCNLDDVPGKC